MPNQSQSSPLTFPPGWGDVIRREEKSPVPEAATTALHLEKESKFNFPKKILLIPLVILIVIALIFGVSRLISRFRLPSLSGSKEVTLTYWGLWEPDVIVNNVIPDWEKDHPDIKIKYVQESHREYRERLQSALARSDGPDIFRFHITWLPMFKNELESVPNTVMSASQFESTYYSVAAANLRSAGGYLGIPMEVDTLSLFINQDIFEAAGKVPPTTWGELRTLAYELRTPQDRSKPIETAGVALGTTNNVDHWSDILGLMMLQNGADLANPTGPLVEDSLKFYTIFNLEDKVWNESLPNSTLAFAMGKVAMYLGFSWDVFEIKNMNPNLKFRIVPAPQLPGTDLAWASFWVEGVAKKSKNKEAAWEFLKFMSSPTIMEKLYQAESKARLFGEPYSRTDMAAKLTSDPMVLPFIKQAPKAQTWYLCSRTWDNGINDRMIKYYEDAINAVNTGALPTNVIPTLTNGVKQLLSQYGLTSKTTR